MSKLIGIAQTSLNNMSLQKKAINIEPDIPAIIISSSNLNTSADSYTHSLLLKADKIDFLYQSPPKPTEVTARITDRTIGIENAFFTESCNIDKLVVRKTYTYTNDQPTFNGIIGYWQADNSFDFTIDNDYNDWINQ